MLPYLIGAGVGFLVGKLFTSSDNKEQNQESADFYVFVRSEDFDKSVLIFSEYKTAKKYYDKFVSDKRVRYKDIVDFDASERKLYDKWKAEGKTGKEGHPNLSSESKIQEISFGSGDNEFESKVFN